MATSHSWNTGAGRIAPRWAVAVPILPNEIVSSWLVRAALTQGCDPLALTGKLWPGWRLWTLDADRRLGPERLDPLVQCSGIERAVFLASTLDPVARQIYGGIPPECGVWQWILALGSRNTKRRGGMQCCLACLNTDKTPYFRKNWRFAWHTCCEKHGCSLVDRCPSCDAPFEPHRLRADAPHIGVCATCHSDIRNKGVGTATAATGALRLQRAMDKAMRDGKGIYNQENVELPEWFRLMRFMATLVRRVGVVQGRGLASLASAMSIDCRNAQVAPGASVESMSISDRQRLFETTWDIVNMPAASLRNTLVESNVTKQAFCPKGIHLPPLLSPVYEALPNNAKPRRRKRRKQAARMPRPPHVVQRMMIRIRRKLEMACR